MQIITNQFQKELKKHGSDHFPFLVSYQRLSEYDSNSFLWHCHPEIEITYIKKARCITGAFLHHKSQNKIYICRHIVFCSNLFYIAAIRFAGRVDHMSLSGSTEWS